MPPNTHPNVAVSYSWKEEREGTHKGAMDAICEQLKNAGVFVVRDKDRMKHGESISAFMQSIGASDVLCVFLCDSYLRSPNCMYELLIAWLKSKDNPDEFRKRVKVWLMPGSVSIFTPEDRLKYTTHWCSERDRLAPIIQAHATGGLASSEHELFRRVKQFAENVNEMLVFFSDSLSPVTRDEFQTWIQSEFQVNSTGTATPNLDDVYSITTKEIEKLLAKNERLQQFVSRAAPDLIERKGTQWKVADTVRNGGFNMCPAMKGVKEELQHYQAVGPTDWQHLHDLVGGLITLSVNPEWVQSQRAAIGQFNEYPGSRDSFPFKTEKEASLLHILSAAIAGGFTLLEKVFGDPHDVVPDPAMVPLGVLAKDQLIELKLHFIKYILGPSVKCDPANPKDLEEVFQNTRDALRYAFEEERAPRFASSPAYRNLVKVIRDNLKLEHLLLIFPNEAGSTRDILTDPVILFSHAYEIFSEIQRKLAA
jgi:hypothetical protein